MTFTVVESCLDGPASAKQSNAISTMIQKIVGYNPKAPEIEPEQLHITTEKTSYSSGNSFKLQVEITPKTTTYPDYHIVSSDESLATVDGTTIKLARLTDDETKTVELTAVSDRNPELKDSLTVTFARVYPETVALTKTVGCRVADGTVIAASNRQFYLAFGLSSTKGAVSEGSYSIEVDPTYLTRRGSNAYIPLKSGLTYVKVTASSLTQTWPLKIEEAAAPVAPASFVPTEGKLQYSPSAQNIELRGADGKAIPGIYTVTSSDTGVIRVDSYDRLVMVKPGEATLTVTPSVGPALVQRYEVEATLVPPVLKCDLAVDSKIKLNENERTAVSLASNPPSFAHLSYSSSNNEVVTVAQDGSVEAVGPGRATITATVSYGTQRVEGKLTVEVSDYSGTAISRFKLFIRKSFGHFSLFAVNGFLIFGAVILWLNGRRGRGLFALGGSALYVFLLAGLTEFIQKFRPGRAGLWSDVAIDTLGGVCGIIVIAVPVFIFLLIKFLIRRHKSKSEQLN